MRLFAKSRKDRFPVGIALECSLYDLPKCKCEYIRGVMQCADCGVALVDALEPSKAGFSENARIVAVWRGNDPAELERVKESLDSAGIPFTAQDTKSAFNFPGLEVWTSEADQERVRKILDDLDDRAHPDELAPEELQSLALPESDDVEDDVDHQEQTEQLSDLSKDWHDDDPVAEVWNGDGEVFADNLIACLREIGIASRKLADTSRLRVVVRPEQELRAKEIVREIVEAAPPE